jgi:hypothetical protein
MNNIESFIREDKQGHIEMSMQEIKDHACRSNDYTVQERQDYFYGISTVFPMMLLGHYSSWLTGKNDDAYMETFVPDMEQKYAKEQRARLQLIYEYSEDPIIWSSAVCSYLTAYPYAILEEFAKWTFSEEQVKKAQEFINKDRAVEIPKLIEQTARSASDSNKREALIVWLGTQYPFDLIERMHRAIFDHDSTSCVQCDRF